MKMRIAIMASLILFSCQSESTDREVVQEESQVEVQKENIVSLSGAITETIYSLGRGEEIVGRDVTSTFPLEASGIDLGHVNQLSIEAVLATSPSLVLYSEKDINQEVFSKINKTQIKVENVEHDFTVEGAKELITTLAGILNVEEYDHLLNKIDGDLAQLQPLAEKPKVLFIYARQNLLMVAGKDTPMQAMVELAGGESAITEFDGFKPLTPEALLQINPDVILLFDKGFQALGGNEGLFEFPGMEQTNAGINKRVVTMDGGLMTNFGPRVGEAALELNQKLIEAVSNE